MNQSEHSPADIVGCVPDARRAAYTIAEFCAAHRISRSKLYELWAAGVGRGSLRSTPASELERPERKVHCFYSWIRVAGDRRPRKIFHRKSLSRGLPMRTACPAAGPAHATF